MVDKVIEQMKRRGVLFDKGLNETEIDHIESEYQIKLPNIWKLLYYTGLPVSKGFYNLRDFSTENVYKIKSIMRVPFESFAPKMNCEKFPSILLKEFEEAPRLFPVYCHRYIPTGSYEDPPVFSIMETDIIVYGSNMDNYVENEFCVPSHVFHIKKKITHIPYWIDILKYSD